MQAWLACMCVSVAEANVTEWESGFALQRIEEEAGKALEDMLLQMEQKDKRCIVSTVGAKLCVCACVG